MTSAKYASLVFAARSSPKHTHADNPTPPQLFAGFSISQNPSTVFIFCNCERLGSIWQLNCQGGDLWAVVKPKVESSIPSATSPELKEMLTCLTFAPQSFSDDETKEVHELMNVIVTRYLRESQGMDPQPTHQDVLALFTAVCSNVQNLPIVSEEGFLKQIGLVMNRTRDAPPVHLKALGQAYTKMRKAVIDHLKKDRTATWTRSRNPSPVPS